MKNNELVELRTLIVSALGLSITTWDIAFNLGVHGTIFYSKLQALWVAATVVLLCVLLAGKGVHSLGWLGVLALLSPTIWFGINALIPIGTLTWFHELQWLVGLGLFVVAIPYILYLLLELVETEFFSLPASHRTRLIGIVLFVAMMGYLIGKFHPYFVSCEQFIIAGDQAPADCVTWNEQ